MRSAAWYREGLERRVSNQKLVPAAHPRGPLVGDRLKLFISYSRRDMAAADALVAALEGEDFEITIDRRDLPYGEEWQNELADFIRGSDTVVWLVSPDSVASKWCNWELGEVGRLEQATGAGQDPRRSCRRSLPESLGKIHLLPAEGGLRSGRPISRCW